MSFVLDIPFSSEIDYVLRNLKPRKSTEQDQVQSEHLKYGGTAISLWIKQVVNAIIEFEFVPVSLKLGIITPLYKSGGKDPLDTNSYRGITLSPPVLAKLLESLNLKWLRGILPDNGLLHINQTAYHKKILCAKAIFSTLEIMYDL